MWTYGSQRGVNRWTGAINISSAPYISVISSGLSDLGEGHRHGRSEGRRVAPQAAGVESFEPEIVD